MVCAWATSGCICETVISVVAIFSEQKTLSGLVQLFVKEASSIGLSLGSIIIMP